MPMVRRRSNARAEAIERSARELLQIVVIDLTATENAQEIFETLNARGAVLTAADLIKNFVFQRLLEQGADVEEAYSKYWAQFETAFWEEEISVGRVRHQRSSVFLNHWLIARTGEEVVAREVFSRFKAYADYQAGHADARSLAGDRSRRGDLPGASPRRLRCWTARWTAWGYSPTASRRWRARSSSRCSSRSLDHKAGPLPRGQIDTSLDVLESWLARRMLIRATAKSYNKIMAEVVVRHSQRAPRECRSDAEGILLLAALRGSLLAR